MADETSQDQSPDLDGVATPNRDRRHDPPVIEGAIAAPDEGAEAPEAFSDEPPATGVEVGSPPRTSAEEPSAAPAIVQPSRPIISAVIGAVVGAVVAAA